MRHNIVVQIPRDAKVSYSLFCQGWHIGVPAVEKDNSFISFKFLGGTVFALFYNFGAFRRAYLCTGWESEADGEKVFLPGVSAPLYLLAKFQGHSIDRLKRILYLITKYDNFSAFKYSFSFWRKVSFLCLTEGKKKIFIEYLLDKHAEDLN